ncbi:MAG: hypothetical protein ABL928_14385 [Sphingorhabdus sp.]
MGFNIGGMFKSLVNPMTLVQLAMGPAGWASIAAKAVMSAIGQQAIQALGEKLGLPQSMIDGAQAAFCSACGDQAGVQRNIREAVQSVGQDFDLSPADQGNLQRTAENALNKLVSGLSESEEFKQAKASGGKTSGSWLMALATVMGEKLNAKAAEVQTLAGQITDKTPDKTAKFGAATQEFGILMNAVNNAIKTLGEGLTTTARKG